MADGPSHRCGPSSQAFFYDSLWMSVLYSTENVPILQNQLAVALCLRVFWPSPERLPLSCKQKNRTSSQGDIDARWTDAPGRSSISSLWDPMWCNEELVFHGDPLGEESLKIVAPFSQRENPWRFLCCAPLKNAPCSSRSRCSNDCAALRLIWQICDKMFMTKIGRTWRSIQTSFKLTCQPLDG